jgi:hypothetical protein
MEIEDVKVAYPWLKDVETGHMGVIYKYML